jgi:hypothetical protein
MPVLDEFVAHSLFQIGALAADARYFIDDILHQMKAIDVGTPSSRCHVVQGFERRFRKPAAIVGPK